MLNSILVVGLLGLFFGFFLSFIYTKFKIEENPLFSKIYELLPKANCGACGFAGCSAFAESLIENKITPEKCVMIEQSSLTKISEILGIKTEKREKFVARVLCYGGINAKKKFEYTTIKNCNVLNAIFDTNFECIYGCLGLGDCVKVCPVNAITINEAGLPEINEEKCVGCGKCAQICPKKIIKMLPYDKKVYIACSSFEKGAIVFKICNSGCIGCGKCMRVCPQNAIKIENNLAIIDYEKCDSCGKCVEECPRKIIFSSKVSILA